MAKTDRDDGDRYRETPAERAALATAAALLIVLGVPPHVIRTMVTDAGFEK